MDGARSGWCDQPLMPLVTPNFPAGSSREIVGDYVEN